MAIAMVFLLATVVIALHAALLVQALDAGLPVGLSGVREPTSDGRAIVAFEAGSLPAVRAGDMLVGLRVVLVATAGDFLVVEAQDVAAVRLAFGILPGVAYVEDDPPIFALAIPNDPRYPDQYGPAMMGFPAAWAGTPGYGSPSVTIAVLDTGINRAHADFKPAFRFLAGHDYVNNDPDPSDDCGHGTAVAGIIAASTNNGLHVAGLSQATILPMKVIGPTGSGTCSGSQSLLAQAILDSRDQGADVISMSLGAPAGSATLANAVDSAWRSGVVLVGAAGNSGTAGIDYPGAYPNVIAVGAVTSGRVRATYSDTGPELDVMAPGSDIESTSMAGGTARRTGTSMATPQVAGAIALALACAPTATVASVRDALAYSSEDLGVAGPDGSTGYGLARADRLVTALCGATSVPDSPADGPFDAAFAASSGCNEWWVDVRVSANTAVAKVEVQAGSAAWSNLPRTSWGTWAASIHVPTGTAVQFRATNPSGATDLSAPAPWLAPAGPANLAPSASFSTEIAGLAVTARSSSTDPDGDVLTLSWVWGTGDTSSGTPTSYTYATAGTKTLTLTVRDGRGGVASSASTMQVGEGTGTDADAGFAAAFAASSGSNEWWVDMVVRADSPVASVQASADGAPYQSLSRTNWGTWAKSFFVARGTIVEFQATAGSGAVAISGPIVWLGDAGPFNPVFDPRSESNNWWVEVYVAAFQVVNVEAQVDAGTWTELPRTSWGTWAKSFFVPDAAHVTFRATDSSATVRTSGTFVWG